MFKEYTFIVDIDGTLCPVKKKNQKYEDLIPNKSIKNRLNEYRNGGAKIVLFTSRNMNSFNNNIGLINKFTAKILLEWLEKWNIPYDEIIYGKPWPGLKGFYVDDRSIRPDEFIKYSIEELNIICENAKILWKTNLFSKLEN